MPIHQLLQLPWGGGSRNVGIVWSTTKDAIYTVPDSVYRIRFNWIIGAGGGGAGATEKGANGGGGGGGSGGTIMGFVISVTPGEQLTISVGQGVYEQGGQNGIGTTTIKRASGNVIASVSGGYAPNWYDVGASTFYGRAFVNPGLEWSRPWGGDGGYPNGITGGNADRAAGEHQGWEYGGAGAPSMHPDSAWGTRVGYGGQGTPGIGYGAGGNGSSMWDHNPSNGRWWGSTGNTGYVEIETVKKNTKLNSPNVSIVVPVAATLNVEVPQGATKCTVVFLVAPGGKGTVTVTAVGSGKYDKAKVTLGMYSGGSGGIHKNKDLDVTGGEILKLVVGAKNGSGRPSQILRGSTVLLSATGGVGNTGGTPGGTNGQTFSTVLGVGGYSYNYYYHMAGGKSPLSGYYEYYVLDDRDAGAGGSTSYYIWFYGGGDGVDSSSGGSAYMGQGSDGAARLLFS